MKERFIRLNEREIDLVEASMKFMKKNCEEYLAMASKRPSVIDAKYVNEQGYTAEEAVYRDVLDRAEALLQRLEDIK